ncbi:glycoside hydrolase family 114 protein [Amniculicola lignicola CBS 123094]|uniref:alpha-galactosidase n=1 Tax=Amniculicola lignicola CBS 123094 TaxID=1392246 RepID=A0A6A5WZJ9_9PLEO|nr:glycoside hydrolase family 114 protein [Amniculicola lignicola CBS 123094]
MFRETKATKAPWSFRRKLLLGAISIVVILGIALGLGLGLTIGRKSGDNDNDSDSNDSNPTPTSTQSPLPSPTGRLPWTPQVNDTWQIILQNTISLEQDATSVTPDVSIFDLDLFNTPTATISKLHRLNKRVLCYFSGGSYEPGRPDSEEFAEADMGKELKGWPGERWLNLSSAGIRKIMEGRVKLAGEKGCDGVDVDNVDGYQNTNGLSLTEADSISFMRFLSNLTNPLNITLGLKNAGRIIPSVLSVVDFSVNEQCVEYAECSTFAAFVDAGKPVFHIEYPSGAGTKLSENTMKEKCGSTGDAKGRSGFSTVLKKMDLDGWVEYCDGSIEVTAVNTTAPY